MIDLDHIDASIHIFDPSIELEEIKARPVPPKHHAFRGQVTRIVLTTLRNVKKPDDGRHCPAGDGGARA